MKKNQTPPQPCRISRRAFATPTRVLAFFTAMMLAFTVQAVPLSTAFTYQGRLSDNGQPANGSYEFEFTLYDALTGGSNLGLLTKEEVQVVDGVFTVQLDYGAGALNGDGRWLEIWVRNDSDGQPGAMLTPRQEITAAPYALMAKTVPDGAISSAKLANNAVTGGKIAFGAVTSGNIAAGAVGTGQLATGAVTAAQIANGGVQAQHMAANSVGAAQIVGGAVTNDKLGAGAAFQNLLGSGQSPVGASGVILSESAAAPALVNAGYAQIGKSDLVAESWVKKLSAPNAMPAFNLAPNANAVVWTGTEFLVWGGDSNAGGRYNPTTNVWTAMSMGNAPIAGVDYKAVWTGAEMIVWGGSNPGGGTSRLRIPGHRFPHRAHRRHGQIIRQCGREPI